MIHKPSLGKCKPFSSARQSTFLDTTADAYKEIFSSLGAAGVTKKGIPKYHYRCQDLLLVTGLVMKDHSAQCVVLLGGPNTQIPGKKSE